MYSTPNPCWLEIHLYHSRRDQLSPSRGQRSNRSDSNRNSAISAGLFRIRWRFLGLSTHMQSVTNTPGESLWRATIPSTRSTFRTNDSLARLLHPPDRILRARIWKRIALNDSRNREFEVVFSPNKNASKIQKPLWLIDVMGTLGLLIAAVGTGSKTFGGLRQAPSLNWGERGLNMYSSSPPDWSEAFSRKFSNN